MPDLPKYSTVEHQHLFYVARTPEDIFTERAVKHSHVCWARIMDDYGRDYVKVPDDKRAWVYCAPSKMNNTATSNSVERIRLHNRTVSRFVWEYFDEFFGPVLTAAGLESCFVDSGLDNPTLVVRPVHNGSMTAFKATYYERQLWESLHVPSDITYEDWLILAAMHITKGKAWHYEFPRNKWMPKSLRNSVELLHLLYSPFAANIIISTWVNPKRSDYSVYSTSLNAVCGEIEKMYPNEEKVQSEKHEGW
jgi:hypothetical protein